MKGQFLRASIIGALGTVLCASSFMVNTAFAAHGESYASRLAAEFAAQSKERKQEGVSESLAKVNDYKKVKGEKISLRTEESKLGTEVGYRSIRYTDPLGKSTSFIEKARVRGDEVLIPLKVFRSVTTNVIFQDKRGQYWIRLPQVEGNGSTYKGKDYNQTIPVLLPLVEKDGVQYVGVSASLGLRSYISSKEIELKSWTSDHPLRERVEVRTPISWVFDPYGGIPYSKPLSPVGTSIVSPSWFELTNDGVRLSGDVRVSYVTTYQKNGYLVWPLITNQFDDELTSRILHNPNSWEHYAQQLALYALVYGYSGYNFDFENVAYKDKQALTTFVTYLSKFLHQFNIYTSIDVTGYSDSENWSMVYDRKRLGEAVDYVALMAYDQYWATSPQAGPVASLPWVKANLEAIAKEVPRDKLVLGVPFYMRLWRTPVVNGKDQRAHSVTLTMNGSAPYKKAFADRMQWLDKEQLHYVTWREPAGPGYTTEQLTAPKTDVEWAELSKAKTYNRYEIWFEDPMSLAAKLDLVKSEGIAGYAAWRKGFEDENTHKLLGEAFVPSEPDRMEAAIH